MVNFRKGNSGVRYLIMLALNILSIDLIKLSQKSNKYTQIITTTTR